MEVVEKKLVLEKELRSMSSMLVAYSGGIDSAFLAYMAHRVLGERMIAVLADSASLARSQMQDAIAFAEEQGIPLRCIRTHELEDESYAQNDSNRCFHCKDELFTVLEKERQRLGFDVVAYGLNAEDKSDFRPGQKAAVRHAVVAPLALAGLGKDEIRLLAKAEGLRVWDKPASACLSSRIEYGRRVTTEALQQVEEAEEGLRSLGFRNFRVRHHGPLARVEIANEEMERALRPEVFRTIGSIVRKAGFAYATVDCEGYRTGSMNEILPVEVLAGHKREIGAAVASKD